MALLEAALDQAVEARRFRKAAGRSLAELIPDPLVQTTSAGMRVVFLHQHHFGVPVLHHGCRAVFDASGTLNRFHDDTLAIPATVPAVPAVSVEEAGREAARYLARSWLAKASWRRSLSRFRPRLLASFVAPANTAVLSRGPLRREMPARLVVVEERGKPRLAWLLTFTLPRREGELDLVVEAGRAGRPAVLSCESAARSLQARGPVFLPLPAPARTEVRAWPPAAAEYPALLRAFPAGFPPDWVDADRLEGNGAAVFLGTAKKAFQPQRLAGGGVEFGADPGESDSQKLLNAFYYCNLMHDFFLGLGFDAQAGSFQQSPTRQGTAADHLEARVFNSRFTGFATMLAREDGRTPELSLGKGPGQAHTALDPDVVLHEYTHGVTERVVGGRNNTAPFGSPQSIALSEGWSDYFALTFQNFGQATERAIYGEWLAAGQTPLRAAPYDDQFPGGFGELGRKPFQSAAACGQVWCAALMRMNRALGRALGNSRRGHQIGWQIVFDGLRLLPAKPGFLTARDHIYAALDDLLQQGLLDSPTHTLAARAVREAFAASGMGAGAVSNGLSLKGNKPDNMVGGNP